ncbi:AAA domain [Carpediemonas membranifera]|uniref:AAA domain n=1 Tax=Carpediemonas membranifera TaxID=201153 RepID=A0A8J6DZ05_9EUKA|nr:AAA domain [Carpediemonas membranifera]|eukprot:KAG9389801.1 AAA domain [Carpediemonas membranifera]
MNVLSLLQVQVDGKTDFFDASMLRKVLSLLNVNESQALSISATVYADLERSATGISSNDIVAIHSVTKDQLWHAMAKHVKKPGVYVDAVDFWRAWQVQFHHKNLIILIGGTSGCGKSTLASLLASRLGIERVVSTDNIRSMMRSHIPASECPILHVSTYNTDTVARSGVDGETRRLSPLYSPDASAAASVENSPVNSVGTLKRKKKDKLLRTPRESRLVLGWRDQCDAVVWPILSAFLRRMQLTNESVIVEGVHLSPANMVLLAETYRCIPVVLYIKDEKRQRHRMAVRSKYMTEDPAHNTYIRHIGNIRKIQAAFTNDARTFKIPVEENSNIDETLTRLHAMLLICLRELGDATDSRGLMGDRARGKGPSTQTLCRVEAIYQGVSDSVERLREMHYALMVALPVLYVVFMIVLISRIVGRDKIRRIHDEAEAKKQREAEKADAEAKQKKEEKKLAKEKKLAEKQAKKGKGKAADKSADKEEEKKPETKKSK